MVLDLARATTASYRLVPPEIAPALVARPALEARLRLASAYRLTTVIAGAGFGKSSLLARVAIDSGWAWYTVDHADEVLSRLARGIIDALLVRLPALAPLVGAARLAASIGSDVDDRVRADAIGEQLCEAAQNSLADDLVLVLDDVHEVAPDTASSRLIEAICRNAPAKLHLVLASRVDPPFPTQRLRGRGLVLEITGPQLAISEEELAGLLASTLGSASRGLAGELYRVTGGWPAAVRLGIEAIRETPAAERAAQLSAIGRPGSPVFEYLAEEVLSGEAPPVGEILRSAARFERFTGGLLAALGIPGASTMVLDLARRGLLVQALGRDEGWFALHALAREFVLERWPLEPDELRDLHRRAAAWFESTGHMADALGSLVAAQDHEAVAALVREHGTDLLAAGAVEAVVRATDALPLHVRDPSVELVAGEGYAILGDIDRALQSFRLAAVGGGAIPAGLAWRTIMALSFRDALEEAMAVFARSKLDREDTADEALLLGWAASIRMRQGDMAACRELATRALEAGTKAGSLQAQANAHVALSLAKDAATDAQEREAHLRQALDAAERAGDMLQVARIRNNQGSVLLEACRYQEAIAELDEAIRLSELAGYVKMQALALLNRGLAYWGQGRLDEAAADYANALGVYRRIGSLQACYALTGLGDIYRERGSLAMALAHYQEALPLAERAGDRQGIVPALYQQARLLIDDDPVEARLLAERAVSYGWPDRVWALNTLGWISLAAGDGSGASAVAKEAGAAAATHHDLWGLGESLCLEAFGSDEPSRQRDLLESALAIYREIGSVVREAEVELALARLSPGTDAAEAAERAERRLREMGVRASAARSAGVLWALARLEARPARLQTLGGFGLVSARSKPRARWRSRKAQTLLKVLVARHGRPTPREFLMEILWPEEDPGELGNRLSVALATVRATLDPGRRFGSDHFVAGDVESLWLDSTSISIDVDRFLAQAKEGLAMHRDGLTSEGVERLEAAEALYTGEFLEEDPYEDWAAPLREEARAVYVEIARRLAEHAVDAGDNDGAVRYLLRVLERDPFDEDAHLLLVTTLDLAGRHGEARRRYRAYVSAMQEIDVEAAPFPQAGRSVPRRASGRAGTPPW